MILFEITTSEQKLGIQGLNQIQKRLGLNSKIVYKNDNL
jgi:hypothetical protein